LREIETTDRGNSRRRIQDRRPQLRTLRQNKYAIEYIISTVCIMKQVNDNTLGLVPICDMVHGIDIKEIQSQPRLPLRFRENWKDQDGSKRPTVTNTDI